MTFSLLGAWPLRFYVTQVFQVGVEVWLQAADQLPVAHRPALVVAEVRLPTLPHQVAPPFPALSVLAADPAVTRRPMWQWNQWKSVQLRSSVPPRVRADTGWRVLLPVAVDHVPVRVATMWQHVSFIPGCHFIWLIPPHQLITLINFSFDCTRTVQLLSSSL